MAWAATGFAATNTATVTAGAKIDVTLNAAGSVVDFTNAFWQTARTWNIVTATALTGTFTLGTVTPDPAGRIASDFGTFAITHTATVAALTWTPAPAWLWQVATFGANATNPAIGGLTANPDGDALNNLGEYATGSNPNAQNSPPAATVLAGRLALTFTRNTAATDVTMIVRGADSPAGPWTDLASSVNGAIFSALAGGVTVTETGAGGTRTVEVRDLYLTNDAAHPTRFLRLHVQK